MLKEGACDHELCLNCLKSINNSKGGLVKCPEDYCNKTYTEEDRKFLKELLL